MKRFLTLLLLPFFCAPTFSHSAETARPNILFAIADDWSFGHAGAYGCDWIKTPNFDRLAAEGLLFNRAYTPNAKCAPSRAIILTGRYSWQLEEAGNHMAIFPAKFGGYVERLEADGYETGYTGKGWGPGIANNDKGKPRKITGKNYSKRKLKPHAAAISNTDYAANFSDFLDAVPGEKPWAFWFGTLEPHRAYEKGVGARLGKKTSDIDKVPAYWPDNETVRNDMLDYAVEVEHYDDHLGKIIAALEAAGQLDNTLIVATSDHGMPFPRAKGQVYEHSNHIPLAIRWPKGITGQGRKIDDYVNFTDLAPTFLEAAGIQDPAPVMQAISGESLFDIFKSDQRGQVNPDRDHVLVGKERHDIGRPNSWGYPVRGIFKNNQLYVKNFEPDRWPAGNPETGYLNCDASPTKTEILNLRRSGENRKFWELCFGKREPEAFYDLNKDPDCVTNQIKSASFAETIDQLKSELESQLTKQGDPRMHGNGEIFDNYPYSSKATDNFYERYMAGEKLKAGWVNPDDFEEKPLD
ncbi:MAG: sulfatase [Verrucomicrobiales bacterium]|nr:sulfatase [Verrucomicrobiales bacterium]